MLINVEATTWIPPKIHEDSEFRCIFKIGVEFRSY